MNSLLYLAEAFIVAYLMREAAIQAKLPAVSGYVVGGVVLGGSLIHWFPAGHALYEHLLFTEHVLEEFEIITEIALGIIALSIGVELGWKTLRRLGSSIIYITLFGAFVPFILVTLVVALITGNIPLAFILGAVASATAPTATVAVIQQYRAKGPLTSTIMAVVGLDDAVSFMLFAFILTVVTGSYGQGEISIMSSVLNPVFDIALSMTIGGLAGLVAAKLLVAAVDNETSLLIIGSLILFVSGISMTLNISDLLANMTAGVVLANVNPKLERKIRTGFGGFSPIFYALFFVVGGAYLDLTVIDSIWFVAIMFFISRSIGKIAGASAGAVAGKAPSYIRKWVGISLLPQLGASTALALAIETEFGSGKYGASGIELAADTINIVLITTILTELIGPYMTRLSLLETGEAKRGQ